MCGIAGFNWNNRDLIGRMTALLHHRGPDDEGTHTDEFISLGHRRLSILDTSKRGSQPMFFKELTIVHNGEIYNFKEIRNELIEIGHKFESDTDTEVILHAFSEWGSDCLSRFNGMWAFCIYNQKSKQFFLTRDRFGIKPLYYMNDKDKFIFASELKAFTVHNLPLEIDKNSLNYYFYQKYVGNCQSIFKNIIKITPGEFITFDLKSKRLISEKYFDLQTAITKSSRIPLVERINSIDTLLQDAVEKRLVSDVPVGSFLSGGLDSSLISSIISKKKKNFQTFSIGFKERSFDESKYSTMVSDHINSKHFVEYLTMNEETIFDTLKQMDEPFGDSSLIPTYLLAQITSNKVKVALSGDAADEIFGGYDTYFAYSVSKFFPLKLRIFLNLFGQLLPPSEKKVSLAFKFKRFFSIDQTSVNRRHLDWMATFPSRERKLLLGNNFIEEKNFINFPPGNDLLSLQINDMQNYLEGDILKKVDIASMLNSLEVRVPFLDHRLVPLVLSLPENFKIRRFKTKFFLKNIASKFLPSAVINRKKRGFTVPVSLWIKKSNTIKKFLSQSEYYSHGLFNKEIVDKLLNDHLKGKIDNSRQLWLIFVFNYWANKSLPHLNN